MRAYSQSQGKIIEIPDQPSTGGFGGGGGMDTDMLKKLIVMKGLSDFKNIGKYSSAMGLIDSLQPEKSAAVQKRELLLKQASPVVSRISKSASTAPTGLKGSLLALLGRIPGVEGGEAEFLKRDTEAFARLIASAFASEVGVATDRDVERWMGLMPKPGDTQRERDDRISKMAEQISNEAQALGMEVPPSISSIITGMGVGNTPNSFIPD